MAAILSVAAPLSGGGTRTVCRISSSAAGNTVACRQKPWIWPR